jgi:hypothetical protein
LFLQEQIKVIIIETTDLDVWRHEGNICHSHSALCAT